MVRAVALLIFSALPALYGVPVTMVDNGPSSNRVDIVFMGDGYTVFDLGAGAYVSHVNSLLNYMFSPGLNTDPFYRYRNYFNVHRIDLVSTESGADVPPLGVFRDTALDATYYWDRVTDRLLYIDHFKAMNALTSNLAGSTITADMSFVTVNDSRYGGGGAAFSVFAGGSGAAREIALHEVAHSFSGLADEYGGFTETYTGPEPSEVNVTTDPSGRKWTQWLGFNQPGVGMIGAYEGARYHDRGLYRPSLNSKMRSLNAPFDAVSREKIILDIYALTNPLDGWLNNSGLLMNPEYIWVDRIDPEVIAMQWFVDGVLVPGATGDRFNPLDFGYEPGTYRITARAYDPTGFDPVDGWVRINTSNLEETVDWTAEFVPEPSTMVLAGLGLVIVVYRRMR